MNLDRGDPAAAPLLIDSHCHLQHLEDPEQALDEARAKGVAGFLVPATRLDEADGLLALCHRHADVWCALGVHPHEASSWQGVDAQRLRALLADPKAVAVGECGLDFHYDHSSPSQQLTALRAQWEVAIELGLPVVIHNRESDEEMLRQVRDPQFAALRGDFHSFAGSEAMARELVGRDFYFGFSGMVTFKAADNIRSLLRLVPDDRILLETDTPYLAPVPHRGEPNQPAWIVEVAQRVASEKGKTVDRIGDLTGTNFFRLFSRAGSGPVGTTAAVEMPQKKTT